LLTININGKLDMRKMIVAGTAVFFGITTTWASLAQWTFETSQPDAGGPYAAENGTFAGTSMASGFHATVNSTTYSSPDGAGSGHSYSAKNWSTDDYYQFTTSTLGYEDITVSFEAASTGKGPKNFDLVYSTDGLGFSTFGSFSLQNYSDSTNPTWDSSMSTADAAFYGFSFDLSSVGTLNNQGTIYLRLIEHDNVSAGGDTVSAIGRTRLDDFTISGSAIPSGIKTGSVPEPATFLAGALLGLAFLGSGIQRLRYHHVNRKI
jgi:hypothetical protein